MSLQERLTGSIRDFCRESIGYFRKNIAGDIPEIRRLTVVKVGSQTTVLKKSGDL